MAGCVHWDLVRLILEKLTIPDNLRLAFGLSMWWKNFKEQPVPPEMQPPWLLIHPLPDNEKPDIAAFFDLSQAKILRIPVPLPPFQERICLGSTDGWIVTITRTTFEAHLLNPVSHQQIDLPRFRHISAAELNEDLNDPSVKETDNEFFELLVDDMDVFFRRSKAVVSWDKREENAELVFTVVIILKFRECTIVVREGQPDWQVWQPPRLYEDFMTDTKGKFFFLDPIDRQVNIRCLQHLDSESSPKHLSINMPQEGNLCFTYLAGWFSGEEPEIFILVKNIPPGSHADFMLDNGEPLFKVFKYDKSVGHFKQVYDLGGNTVFVGASNAIVLSLPELRSNNVYYVDASNYPNEVCIYDMEEHSFQRTVIGVPSRLGVSLDAVWLSPSC